MQIKYSSNKLEKQLCNPSELKKAFGLNAKRVAARMEDLKASPNLAVLIQLPAAKCHPLTGDRDGEWAVSISANHRLIFEIAHNPIPITKEGVIDTITVTDIRILETTDYH